MPILRSHITSIRSMSIHKKTKINLSKIVVLFFRNDHIDNLSMAHLAIVFWPFITDITIFSDLRPAGIPHFSRQLVIAAPEQLLLALDKLILRMPKAPYSKVHLHLIFCNHPPFYGTILLFQEL